MPLREQCGFFLFAHHREAIARLHDALDFQKLVTGHNDEVRWVGAYALVLDQRHGHLFDATLVGALAEEVEVSREPLALLNLLDPLVHLAEQNFITTQALLSLRHASNLSRSATALPGADAEPIPHRIPQLFSFTPSLSGTFLFNRGEKRVLWQLVMQRKGRSVSAPSEPVSA